MSEIKIRGVDPVIVKKIDQIAKKHGMSRNEYLKRSISKFAVMQDVADLDSKYRELVNILLERLEQTYDVIEMNNAILEKITGGHE